MQEIDLTVKDWEVDFDTARKIALSVAGQDEEEHSVDWVAALARPFACHHQTIASYKSSWLML
jgi:hypothetical protein